MYALYLLKLGKMELFLFRFREALEHLEMVVPILRVTHGKEHPLFASDLLPLLKQAKQEANMVQMSGLSISKRNQGRKVNSISN